MALTKTAARVLDKMLALLNKTPASGWEAVPSSVGLPTIRLTRTVQTPDYARERRGTLLPLWDDATYDELLFVTLVGGKVILGHASCPWVARHDWDETFWYVEMLLDADDPWAVLRDRLKIKSERRLTKAGQPKWRTS